jgi:hypothetical protein
MGRELIRKSPGITRAVVSPIADEETHRAFVSLWLLDLTPAWRYTAIPDR